MSIKKRSKWVKDGEVVKVVNLRASFPYDSSAIYENCVWFSDKDEILHILTRSDFLEQYKPYKAVNGLKRERKPQPRTV